MKRFDAGITGDGFGHDARDTLRQDQRMSGGKIRWQRFKFRHHSATESYSSKTSKQNRHPTEVGLLPQQKSAQACMIARRRSKLSVRR
jgi:hypothetical protein